MDVTDASVSAIATATIRTRPRADVAMRPEPGASLAQAASIKTIFTNKLDIMNNLFISYDLNDPGQNYAKVIDTIKALGSWAKVQKSFWYVKSTLSAQEAVTKVWAVMDKNDSLIVVDASNRNASWQGLDPVVAKHIIDNWSK